MAANSYEFQTTWHFKASVAEVAAILEDVDHLSTWWPSVYLEVRVLEEGEKSGVGKRVALFTKGWLPYTLRWNFTVVESNSPYGFRIKADGDFVGEGVWTLMEKEGDEAEVVFDWTIHADKPLLRAFSFILKPMFSANHRWAMEQGEKSLNLELLRRRGEPKVLPPPPATWPHRARRA